MRLKIVFSLLVVLVLVEVGFIVRYFHKDYGKLIFRNIYRGELDVYEVTIEETRRVGKETFSIVELHPMGTPSYVSITGHVVGEPDEAMRLVSLFYCGMPDQKNGCNSVKWDGGKWKWNPCPADKGRVKPFTATEISLGRVKIKGAIDRIYNDAHLVRSLDD